MLIVLSHSLNAYTPSKLFINLFNVTVFFVISGYFFKAKYYENITNIKIFLISRIKGLYLPYVITNVVMVLLNNFFIKIHLLTINPAYSGTFGFTKVYTISKIIQKTLLSFVMWDSEITCAPIWFFRCLFWISLCFCLGSFVLNKIINNKKYFELSRFIIVLITTFLGYFLYTKNFNFYQIGTMLSCSGVFYIGILFKKYINISKVGWSSLLISFVILLICNLFNPTIFFIGTNYYNNPFWLILASICGFIFVLSISKILTHITGLTQVCYYIGQNTRIIMCLHLLSFRLVNLIQILLFAYPIRILSVYASFNPNNSIWWICYLAIGLSVPVFFEYI